ncbi:hypothetical protein ACFL3S_10995 [Gemmatimonadota bacterium]
MRPFVSSRLFGLSAFPSLLLWAGAVLFTEGLGAQEVYRPDLAGIAGGNGWTLHNRGVEIRTEGGEVHAVFDGRPGDGAAWLDELQLENGEIEIRIRGKNVPQRSFVGIAFRGLDDEIYDAVYFRPFNFLADNPVSRSHSVQYVSHPDHTWARLREEHTGTYENSLSNPPDPDGFFRVRIVLEKPQVRVFVNDEAEPCLVVEELTDRRGGRIGLWMGNNSDGTFADLEVRSSGVGSGAGSGKHP